MTKSHHDNGRKDAADRPGGKEVGKTIALALAEGMKPRDEESTMVNDTPPRDGKVEPDANGHLEKNQIIDF